MSTKELKEQIQKEMDATDNEAILSKVLAFIKDVKADLNQDDVHPEFEKAYEKITKKNVKLLKRLAE